jgi:hypothetical protein
MLLHTTFEHPAAIFGSGLESTAVRGNRTQRAPAAYRFFAIYRSSILTHQAARRQLCESAAFRFLLASLLLAVLLFPFLIEPKQNFLLQNSIYFDRFAPFNVSRSAEGIFPFQSILELLFSQACFALRSSSRMSNTRRHRKMNSHLGPDNWF